MQLEQRLDRVESNLGRLTGVVELLATNQEALARNQQTTARNLETIVRTQQESLDLIGLTVQGQAQIASRQQQMDAAQLRLDQTVAEIGDKLNALIAVVDQMIRGKLN